MSNTSPTDAPATDEAAPEPAPTVHGFPLIDSLGQAVVHVPRSEYVGLIKKLLADGYAMAIDLCGVDFLTHPGRSLPEGMTAERFEVVVNLLDIEHRRRLRVRVQVPESEPTCPSLFDMHPGTEAMEREAFDMFGIVFTNHPDLTRILMPEDWEGYPLRKDYSVGAIPVQFSADYARANQARANQASPNQGTPS
jgi:NADH-quinone oxidoreductase subunit C